MNVLGYEIVVEYNHNDEYFKTLVAKQGDVRIPMYMSCGPNMWLDVDDVTGSVNPNVFFTLEDALRQCRVVVIGSVANGVRVDTTHIPVIDVS